MRAECAWLASYEKDSARFKVCFCNPCSRHAAHCLVTAGMPRAPECLGEGVSMLALSNHDAKIEWHALVGMLPFHAEHIARVAFTAQVLQGRDANRNLQRSLKAAKLRERLPAAVQQLQALSRSGKTSVGLPLPTMGAHCWTS